MVFNHASECLFNHFYTPVPWSHSPWTYPAWASGQMAELYSLIYGIVFAERLNRWGLECSTPAVGQRWVEVKRGPGRVDGVWKGFWREADGGLKSGGHQSGCGHVFLSSGLYMDKAVLCGRLGRACFVLISTEWDFHVPCGFSINRSLKRVCFYFD